MASDPLKGCGNSPGMRGNKDRFLCHVCCTYEACMNYRSCLCSQLTTRWVSTAKYTRLSSDWRGGSFLPSASTDRQPDFARKANLESENSGGSCHGRLDIRVYFRQFIRSRKQDLVT